MGASLLANALSVCMRTGRVAWLFVVLLCGCRTASTVTSVSAPTSGSPRIPSQNPSIQRSPVYREAAALFEKKQFREAIAKLDLLTDDPDLTPADREFLKHQRQICVDAVSGKPTPVVSAPVPASTPTSPRLGDCGPRALVIVAQQLGVKANPAELTKAAGTTTHGASLDGLKHAAKSIGLKAEGVQMDRMALSQLDHPAIAWVDGNHYLAVLKVDGEEATVHDPNKPREEVIATEDLLRRSGGILLTLRKD